jgi:hypothetical protein
MDTPLCVWAKGLWRDSQHEGNLHDYFHHGGNHHNDDDDDDDENECGNDM